MTGYLLSILYLIFILIDKNKSINIEVNFPTTIPLPSGNLFVLSSEGINVYNYNFSINLFSYIFDENEKIKDYDESKMTSIANYFIDNNCYILCLTKGLFLYLFDHNNYKLKKVNIDDINDGIIYNLIPYKYYHNSIEYIISYISFNYLRWNRGEYKIKLLLFKLSFSEEICQNFLISNNSIKNINENNQKDKFEFYLSCQKGYFNNNNLLICFYPIDYKKIINVTVFDIAEKFKVKNSTYYSYNSDYKIIEIDSGLAFNDSKIFVCGNIYTKFSLDYLNTDCFLYDIESNNIVFKYKQLDSCYDIKIDNYNQIYELKLICYTNRFEYGSSDNQIEVYKFENDFEHLKNEDNEDKERIQTIDIYNCKNMNSFSLIYNNIHQKFDLISDCPNNNQYYISNNSYIIDISNYIPYNNNDLNSSILQCSIENFFDFYTSKVSSTDSPIYPSEFSSTDSPINDNLNDNSIPIKYEINKTKEDIVNNITEFIESIDFGKFYVFEGKDFVITIRPTNASYSPNSTYIDVKECEDALRNFSNIPSSKLLTIFQMEVDNNDDQSLVNQVEYQIYDDNKKLLDLSVCDNIDIKVTYACKEDKIEEIESANYFKDMGIDIFNISDDFFNDICHPYSESDNDVVLKDRIKYLYKNFSLCNDGCMYNGIDLDNKTISCNCKVKKSNITLEMINSTLKKLDEINVDSNFALIKCYNLVFSSKNKSKNVGFWIFLFLILAHVPLLTWFFYKGLKPIIEYIFNEMKKFGYIDDEETKKKTVKKKEEKKEKKKKEKKTSNKNMSSPPPKHSRSKESDNSSLNSIKPSERKIIKEINPINIVSIDNKPLKDITNDKVKLTINNNKDKNKIKKRKNAKVDKNNNIIVNNNINVLQTQVIDKNNIKENEENESKKAIFNFNLININLNNVQEYTPQRSSHILNNYTFKEAVQYDMRSILAIFYIFLLSKQALCHAFLYRSPLELFPLRLCLLIFIISCDLALNAFFYLDDKISNKYKYAQNLFLFTFNSNTTIILLSTLIGFVFMTLWTNLGNSTNELRNVFRNEEEKIQQDKKYTVSKKRKKEIVGEIEKILKKYKIKVIILLSIEISLMFFFWYYVTAFCHVYPSTQASWVFDSFLSMLSRLIIIALLSMLFAKLYRMAIESSSECIYKFVLFFYSFG